MMLTWPQINDLAAALTAAQLDIDRVSLTSDQLISLIGAVTGDILPVISDEEANAIKWQWMKLSDQPPVAAQAGGRG